MSEGIQVKVMLTVGRYFKRRFGEKVRKIPISLSGFTCPNIDGTVAKGGCIYCKNESFSPSLLMKKKQDNQINISNFTPLDSKNIVEEAENTKDSNDETNIAFFQQNKLLSKESSIKKDMIKSSSKIKMNFSISENPLLNTQLKELESQFEYHSNYHKNKFGISKYMVYFQSFTNTYAPFHTLKTLYSRALSLPNVVGMSIGTRVDCVDSKLLDYLQGFVKEGKEIWLEYGIQSIYEDTLKITNRGHSMEGVKELFAETRKRGIKLCAHLIYGLPNETVDMMINSLQTILDYGVDSLKIHPLYVVEGTMLARMYKKGEYSPISLEDYSDAIIRSLKIIPPTVVIQRVSAGAHDETLIAPKWCFDKNIQMRYLRDRLKKEGIEY